MAIKHENKRPWIRTTIYVEPKSYRLLLAHLQSHRISFSQWVRNRIHDALYDDDTNDESMDTYEIEFEWEDDEDE